MVEPQSFRLGSVVKHLQTYPDRETGRNFVFLEDVHLAFRTQAMHFQVGHVTIGFLRDQNYQLYQPRRLPCQAGGAVIDVIEENTNADVHNNNSANNTFNSNSINNNVNSSTPKEEPKPQVPVATRPASEPAHYYHHPLNLPHPTVSTAQTRPTATNVLPKKESESSVYAASPTASIKSNSSYTLTERGGDTPTSPMSSYRGLVRQSTADIENHLKALNDTLQRRKGSESSATSSLRRESSTTATSPTDNTEAMSRLEFKLQTLAEQLQGVSEQVGSVDTKTDEVLRKQQQALDRLALIQRKAEAILVQNYELLEYTIPRLFIILPEQASKWDPIKKLRNTFRLHFICECGEHTRSVVGNGVPHQLHLARHEGYVIRQPTEFFVRYGPFLLVMLEMLKFGVSCAGMVAPALSNLKIVNTMSNAQDTLKSVMESTVVGVDMSISFLEELRDNQTSKGSEVLSEQQQHAKTIQRQELRDYLAGVEALQGVDLRQLESFLQTNSSDGNLLGNLFRMTTPEGHVKWVCRDHFHAGHYEASIQGLREMVKASSNGIFDEQLGKVTVTLTSGILAGQMYDAIKKIGSGIQELDFVLGWNQDHADLVRLRDLIKKLELVTLSIDLQKWTGPDFEIILNGKRYDTIMEMIRQPSIRKIQLKGVPFNFFRKISVVGGNSFGNLQVVKILIPDLLREEQEMIRLKSFLTILTNLKSLTLYALEPTAAPQTAVRLMNLVMEARSGISTDLLELNFVRGYDAQEQVWFQVVLPTNVQGRRMGTPLKVYRNFSDLVRTLGSNIKVLKPRGVSKETVMALEASTRFMSVMEELSIGASVSVLEYDVASALKGLISVAASTLTRLRLPTLTRDMCFEVFGEMIESRSGSAGEGIDSLPNLSATILGGMHEYVVEVDWVGNQIRRLVCPDWFLHLALKNDKLLPVIEDLQLQEVAPSEVGSMSLQITLKRRTEDDVEEEIEDEVVDDKVDRKSKMTALDINIPVYSVDFLESILAMAPAYLSRILLVAGKETVQETFQVICNSPLIEINPDLEVTIRSPHIWIRAIWKESRLMVLECPDWFLAKLESRLLRGLDVTKIKWAADFAHMFVALARGPESELKLKELEMSRREYDLALLKVILAKSSVLKTLTFYATEQNVARIFSAIINARSGSESPLEVVFRDFNRVDGRVWIKLAIPFILDSASEVSFRDLPHVLRAYGTYAKVLHIKDSFEDVLFAMSTIAGRTGFKHLQELSLPTGETTDLVKLGTILQNVPQLGDLTLSTVGYYALKLLTLVCGSRTDQVSAWMNVKLVDISYPQTIWFQMRVAPMPTTSLQPHFNSMADVLFFHGPQITAFGPPFFSSNEAIRFTHGTQFESTLKSLTLLNQDQDQTCTGAIKELLSQSLVLERFEQHLKADSTSTILTWLPLWSLKDLQLHVEYGSENPAEGLKNLNSGLRHLLRVQERKEALEANPALVFLPAPDLMTTATTKRKLTLERFVFNQEVYSAQEELVLTQLNKFLASFALRELTLKLLMSVQSVVLLLKELNFSKLQLLIVSVQCGWEDTQQIVDIILKRSADWKTIESSLRVRPILQRVVLQKASFSVQQIEQCQASGILLTNDLW